MRNFLYLIFFIKWVFIGYLCEAQKDLYWVDLPAYNLCEIFDPYDSVFDTLNDLIQDYHKIEKGSWACIPSRIDALENISFHAKELSKILAERSKKKYGSALVRGNYLEEIALKLFDMAVCKKQYLQEIKDLKEFKLKELENSLWDQKSIQKPYSALFIFNKRAFIFSDKEVRGQYFIEAIDPCHRRYLNSYYNIWVKKYPHQDLSDFFLWLEDKEVSTSFPSVKLVSQEDLKKYKVTIKDGKFYSADGQLITTEGNNQKSLEPIFIIDSKEQIYLGYSSKDFSHASLSHYKPIIGSGAIWLKNGVVQKISLSSGHYCPQPIHNIQTFKFLENKGIKIEDAIELELYVKYRFIITTIGEFRKYYLQQPLPSSSVNSHYG